MWRFALIAALVALTACQVPHSSPAAPAVEPLFTHAVPATSPDDERLTVFLHGYGSNELDLIGLGHPLGLGGDVVSVRAPQTAGRGYAWFPIEFTPDGTRYPADAADEPLHRLAAQLRALHAERRRPIVVVGFSQGAMMAMLLAAEHPEAVDAAVAFSGALPRKPRVADRPAPIFMAHGQADQVVPLARAQRSRSWLAAGGVDVELFEVPGLAHRTSPESLARARAWLAEHCPAQGCGGRDDPGAH